MPAWKQKERGSGEDVKKRREGVSEGGDRALLSRKHTASNDGRRTQARPEMSELREGFLQAEV